MVEPTMEQARKLADVLNELEDEDALDGDTWTTALSDFGAEESEEKSEAYFPCTSIRVVFRAGEGWIPIGR